jgi:hypothetical protein
MYFSTLILRQFYLRYIRPKITYACEIWGDLAEVHLQKIQNLQNCALRICLGCPKTSPINAMEIELNIEPLHMYIKKRSGKLSLKYKTLLPEQPSSHLIPSSLAHKHSFQYQSYTAISEDYYLCQAIPPVNEIPPWKWIKPTIAALPEGITKQTTHPEVLRAITLQHNEEKYNTNLHIYTDGSVNSACNKSGAGYFIPSTNKTFSVPANSKASVDSELLGINTALVSCLTSNEKEICIFTDSRLHYIFYNNIDQQNTTSEQQKYFSYCKNSQNNKR